MDVPLPREERESVVRIGWGDETMTFSTTNPAHARHMERIGVKPDRVTRVDDAPASWTFTCPASWFKLPGPKRQVGESQRQAAAERMKARRVKQRPETAA